MKSSLSEDTKTRLLAAPAEKDWIVASEFTAKIRDGVKRVTVSANPNCELPEEGKEVSGKIQEERNHFESRIQRVESPQTL